MPETNTKVIRNPMAIGEIDKRGHGDAIATTPRFALYLSLILAGLVGGGALLSFMILLFKGPYNVLKLDLGPARSLLLDSFLCMVFFIQHSVMARRSFRQQLTRILPKKYFGPFYAVASGIVLLFLVLLWQESAYQLFEARGVVRSILRAAFLLAILNVIWVLSVGLLPLFRLQTIVDELRRVKPQPASLIVHGPFRRTRHPLYFSSLVLLWSYPDLTLDRLLLNVLFSIWVIVGTLLEERDLNAGFGDSYRDFRKRVPMLIPRLIRTRSKWDDGRSGA